MTASWYQRGSATARWCHSEPPLPYIPATVVDAPDSLARAPVARPGSLPPVRFSTADLSDAHPDAQVADPGLRDFGGVLAFAGPVQTVHAPEDNSLVRAELERGGQGRVLVVDGGGSTRCALLGDRLAALGVERGWAGVVVNGCVRDTADLAGMPLGVKALGSHPRRSEKRGLGAAGVPVEFLGVRIEPGWWCYADADGVVVADHPLHGPVA